MGFCTARTTLSAVERATSLDFTWIDSEGGGTLHLTQAVFRDLNAIGLVGEREHDGAPSHRSEELPGGAQKPPDARFLDGGVRGRQRSTSRERHAASDEWRAP